jgi:arabinogalactan endo-1,4-beta-galactosidase
MCSTPRQKALFFWAAAPIALGLGRVALGDPFYIGSDISLVPTFESAGAVYQATQTSAPQAPDQILYDAGDNLFRVRLFVNPVTNYSQSVQGDIQNDAYDISLLQTLKANDPNAAIELDLMYSDSWASIGTQTEPAAWQSLNQTQLVAEVGTYTSSTLTQFKNAGVMPNIVQLGNEINSGFLNGAGTSNTGGMINFSADTTADPVAGWTNFATLMNTAIAAVRTAQGTGPTVQIAIHIANGAETFTGNPAGEPQYYFPNLQSAGVTGYNIEGVSFYDGNGSTITLANLKTNLTALANMYPSEKILVEETNYPYETGPTGYSGYPETLAGQAQEFADVKNVVLNLPNGVGEGVIYWEPEGVQVPGMNVYNAGATALFYADPAPDTPNTWILNPYIPAAFAVPEPASSALLFLAAPLMLRRNRRTDSAMEIQK